MPSLKFWKWRFRRPKEEEEDEEKKKPPTLYPSKNMVLVTTETDLKLKPTRVLDDHKIQFEGRTVDIDEKRPAHILDFKLTDLFFTRKMRLYARLFRLPKYQTFRVYTAQQEGETTHDPNATAMTEEQKMRIEKMIRLKATAIKAEIAASIMAGLKGKRAWWEVLGPLIIMTVIVFFFLFAFQIQPNM